MSAAERAMFEVRQQARRKAERERELSAVIGGPITPRAAPPAPPARAPAPAPVPAVKGPVVLCEFCIMAGHKTMFVYEGHMCEFECDKPALGGSECGEPRYARATLGLSGGWNFIRLPCFAAHTHVRRSP